MKVLMFILGAMLAASGTADAQKASRAPIVTVRQMTDMAKTGQAPAFAQMIQSAIAATGKFRIIESNFADLRDQQELGNSGMVTTNRPGKRGGFEGADFLIYGTITAGQAGRQADQGAQIGQSVQESVLGKLGLRGSGGGGQCAKIVSTLAVDVKIVDGSTGEIRYTKNINQTAIGRTSCSGDAQLDIAAMLRSAANQIAFGLVTTIYPMKIASVQPDGSLLLNYGEGVVSPGLLLAVYGAGQEVRDPDSNALLTSEGAQIGLARIVEVMPRFSKAMPEGSFAQPPKIGYIARLAPPPVPGVKGKRK